MLSLFGTRQGSVFLPPNYKLKLPVAQSMDVGLPGWSEKEPALAPLPPKNIIPPRMPGYISRATLDAASASKRESDALRFLLTYPMREQANATMVTNKYHLMKLDEAEQRRQRKLKDAGLTPDDAARLSRIQRVNEVLSRDDIGLASNLRREIEQVSALHGIPVPRLNPELINDRLFDALYSDVETGGVPPAMANTIYQGLFGEAVPERTGRVLGGAAGGAGGGAGGGGGGRPVMTSAAMSALSMPQSAISSASAARVAVEPTVAPGVAPNVSAAELPSLMRLSKSAPRGQRMAELLALQRERMPLREGPGGGFVIDDEAGPSRVVPREPEPEPAPKSSKKGKGKRS